MDGIRWTCSDGLLKLLPSVEEDVANGILDPTWKQGGQAQAVGKRQFGGSTYTSQFLSPCFKTSAAAMAACYTPPLTKGQCDFTNISSVAELHTGCRLLCVLHAS